MRSAALLLLVGLASAPLACAESDGPERRTRDELAVALLSRELAPSARQLMPFVLRTSGDPTTRDLAVLSSRERASARTLVDVALAAPPDTLGLAQLASSALFVVDAAGAIRLLPRGPEAVVPAGTIVRRPVPALGAIVNCTAVEANGVRLEGDAVVAFEDASAVCSSADLAGESRRAGRWLRLEKRGTELRTQSRSIKGEAPEARTLTLPDVAAVVVFAREDADGAVSAVVRTSAGFAWLRAGSAPVALALPDAARYQLVASASSNELVLRAADGAAVLWSPDKGTDQRLAAPASPEGSSGFVASGDPSLPFAEVATPNPRFLTLRVPQRYVVARLAAGALQLADAALTPCAEAGRCKVLGESYLLGVVGDRGADEAPIGLYAFWSWESQAALVAAPLRVGGAP